MTKPAPSRSAPDHELLSIQCLRGIAAMMVVAFHAFPQLQRMGYEGREPPFLSAGVDIFFIISGFIMLYSAHRSPARGGGAFLLNRAIRILPLYWILTTVLVMVALFAPQLLYSTRLVPGHAIMSYLMLPAIHPVTGLYQPILIPGWTLNYEMFFYLIFALGLWLVTDRGRKLAVLTGGIIVAVTLLPLRGAGSFYTNGVIVEFAYGLAMACLFLAGKRIGKRLCIVAMVAGFAVMAINDHLDLPDVRFLVYGLPALLVFAGALYLPLDSRHALVRLMRILGDASYSIYLSHMMTMAAFGMAWRKAAGSGFPGSMPLFVLFSLPVCAFAGWVCYRLIEQPVTRRLKETIGRRRAARPDPFPARGM